eukprot:11818440-Karenia_brevis.AAC.1
MIRTCQRRMLRKIVQVGRRLVDDTSLSSESSSSCTGSTNASLSSELTSGDTENEQELEPWIVWLRRATGISESLAQQYGVCDWVEEQKRRKWRLAGHTARRDDARWSWKLLSWLPAEGKRSLGRP